ncbi:MAG: outer membrane protein assembly factor [bacterium]
MMNHVYKKNICLLLVSIWLPVHLLAQDHPVRTATLNQIEIHGAEKNKTKMYDWLNLKKGEAISESILQTRARETLLSLQKRGFYFAKIDSVLWHYFDDSTKVNLRFYVNEGEQLRVAQFDVHGLPEQNAHLQKELETSAGEIFFYENLHRDIDFLVSYFENAGYPYCQIHVSDFKMTTGKTDQDVGISVTLEVDLGPLVTISAIEIVGNTETKDYVIKRALGLEENAVYEQSTIDKIVPKLMRLGYFKWVNPPKLQWQNNGTGKLIIELAEGSNNRFDGVIGYNPPTSRAAGFVTGLIQISFRNLLGTGRQIEANWNRRSAQTQEIRLAYTEPWIAGLPLDAGVHFEQLIQDTSYVQRRFGLDTRLQIGDNLSLFSGFSRRTVSPDSLAVLLFGLPKSSSINLSVGLSFNTLDHVLNPRKGVKYETAFEWSRKNIDENGSESPQTGSGDSFNQRRLSLDFESYFSLFRWQVLALSVHGRQITSSEKPIPITEQFRFGGSRTLRGYREEQFRGSRIAWANFEYRYLLNRESRFFIFFDSGYFFREETAGFDIKKIESFKAGFGFGLRLETKLGYFGIDYGLGQGDSLSNGKVHIGLTNAF